VSTRERARDYLLQGQTLRAAGLMLNLIEAEPTSENLALLAGIYMQQGLFDDAKELYLRVVMLGLKEGREAREVLR